MSLRLQLLQRARLAPIFLANSTELVRDFYRHQFDRQGAAHDRAGKPDLYYTIFALAGAQALEVPVPVELIVKLLGGFGEGSGLDLVHLGALARCWAAIGNEKMSHGLSTTLLARFEQFRKTDGGYEADLKATHGTAYGSFVALGAYQDLGQMPPKLLDLGRSLRALQTADGVWSNAPGQRLGALNATAGAVVLLRELGLSINSNVGDWILAQEHPEGGFLAVPGAPMPDLLSTATALHALSCLERRISSDVHERCLNFIDTLWSAEGGFHGHWADDFLDAEYTFYGLLALGHLSSNP
jgi:prenyltransferase beta subunit